MKRLVPALALLALVSCKRKQEATALDRDDGRNKTKDCALVEGGVIAKDATLQASCLVTVGESYTIKAGATLRIEKGARLAFKKGARIVVEDGAIVADGTKAEPIVFTSAEKAPAAGDWGGLLFASEKPSSLIGVVVEYAGDEPKLVETPEDKKAAALAAAKTFGIIGALSGVASIDQNDPVADRRPAIFVAPKAKLTLVDSIVRNASNVGLSADGDEPFERCEGNEFGHNGGLAMDVVASALGKVTSITASEPVRVRGAVTKSQTWPKISSGILVGSLRVDANVKDENAVLTLAEGTVLRVAPKASIRFGGVNEGGALVAKKVLFTSAAEKPAPGDWTGIIINRRAPGTLIDGCTIEYAGWEPPSTTTTTSKPAKKSPPKPKPSAITIQEHMKDFEIIHTTFRNNAGPGMGKSELLSLFGGGTGGCEGLDAPKNDNKSIGQPLCEYHEDPYANLFGPIESGATLGALGGLDAKSADNMIAGPGLGLGTIGKGSGGGGGGGGTGYGAGGGGLIGTGSGGGGLSGVGSKPK